MLYIIRHGQTELNSRRLLQGRTDVPLNQEGLSQARQTGSRLKSAGIRFDHVFSSPLIRAVRTAELVADGCCVQVEPRLIEMDYGPWEGMDLTAPEPEVLAFFRDFIHVPAPEGMEPLDHVVERVGSFIEELRDLSGNILLSTHAIAMKGILEYLTPDSKGSYWSTYIGNCEIYRADLRDRLFTVPRPLDPHRQATPGV